MAKGLYVGNDNDLSRKGKKAYFSPDGTSKKVKKIYIGDDNNLSRLIFSSDLAYKGNDISLSVPRNQLAATSMGKYALFGGGYDWNGSQGYFDTVDAFDTSLVRTIPSALQSKRRFLVAASIPDCYSLFFGGDASSNSNGIKTDVYNTSLTKQYPQNATGYYWSDAAATNVGDWVVKAGGLAYNIEDSQPTAHLQAYDKSLTLKYGSSLTDLKVGRHKLAATTLGGYALFGGGRDINDNNSAVVDVYDTSLTKIAVLSLGTGRMELAAATVGGYALFMGGHQSAAVVGFDASLTQITAQDLTTNTRYAHATAAGDYALVHGYYNATGQLQNSNIVFAYDTSLTQTLPEPFGKGRYVEAATSIGNFALFGGGCGVYDTAKQQWCIDSIEVYEV